MHVGTRGAFDEHGRAADGAEGSDGAVYASRDLLLCPREERFGLGVTHDPVSYSL